MKKLIPINITAIILMVFSFSLCLQAVEIMKLSEIKAGMEGVGKSTLKGTVSETYTFKVLGIIENFAPHKHLIMVKLDSPELNTGGIVSGMSGSPAYIDDKLIGAIAYGFPFSRQPIGGITPIEDIMQTAEYETPTFTIDISTMPVEFDKKNLSVITGLVQEQLAKRLNFSGNEAFSPIRLIGIHRGFKPSAFSYLTALKPVLSLGNGAGIAFAANNITTNEPGKDLLKISPADMVSIPLIKGDLEFAAYGTVTHVEDDKIYMFGHPFFNLGTVDFPLHKAEVISVVPSFQEPFLLVTSKQMIGRVLQDRFSAVMGELGQLPYMVPMKVFLKNRNRQFNIEMVHHPLLTPILSAFSIYNIFSSEFQQVGFQSVKVDGKIFIEGEKNIVIDDLFSGTDSYTELSNLLLVITYFLMNNNEKSIKIQKIDFEIGGSEILRRAYLENVLIEKKSYLPGEIMNVTVYLRNERGKDFSETINLKAPNLKAGSEFYLLAADSDEMGQFDARNVRSTYFPTKLSFLIRAINNLRKNNRLYFKFMTPTSGLFVKGQEYPDLPPSLKNVLDYDSMPLEGMSPGDEGKIKYSTIKEYQMEFPSVVRGKKLFKLTIKERSDAE
jgi:hypothetical protein